MKRVVVTETADDPGEGKKGKKTPPEVAPVAKRRATRPNARRPLPDEFFELNKMLLRYTERLARLRRDDRFPRNVQALAGQFDSDLARMESRIANVRRDFAASLDPETKEDDGSGD